MQLPFQWNVGRGFGKNAGELAWQAEIKGVLLYMLLLFTCLTEQHTAVPALRCAAPRDALVHDCFSPVSLNDTSLYRCNNTWLAVSPALCHAAPWGHSCTCPAAASVPVLRPETSCTTTKHSCNSPYWLWPSHQHDGGPVSRQNNIASGCDSIHATTDPTPATPKIRAGTYLQVTKRPQLSELRPLCQAWWTKHLLEQGLTCPWGQW